MKIYTKTGDKGSTSLVGGTRVEKNDLRLEAYGTVDELNSWLGFIAAFLDNEEVREQILSVQHKLFDLGCALATEADSKWQPKTIKPEDVIVLEAMIDKMDAQLPGHDKFILPGGSKASCSANIARTVCRRAERVMVSLPDNTFPGQGEALRYVNRLSDYLFVLSRFLNFIDGCPEIFWNPEE